MNERHSKLIPIDFAGYGFTAIVEPVVIIYLSLQQLFVFGQDEVKAWFRTNGGKDSLPDGLWEHEDKDKKFLFHVVVDFIFYFLQTVSI